ncbi:MAG: DNA-processing protein DprA [Planctomycetota bacterium]
MSQEALLPLLTLNATRGIGTVLLSRLLARFGSAEAALRASEADLLQVRGVRPSLARGIREARESGAGEKDLALAERIGARVIAREDPDYPALLRQTADPPILLYVQGTLLADETLALAVVGTRQPTPYGEQTASRLAQELSRRGVTIVSGLARGIDTFAHQGALNAKGRTIAVLGSGLGHVYPPENQGLARKIASSGAVLSEMPCTTGPDARNFPRRNRIVSGLSLGVLVVEAPEKSGAIITCDWALEQGREVFAVPGKIDSPASGGCHKLLQQGAKLVTRIEDVFEELGPYRALVKPAEAAAAAQKEELDENQQAVMELLESDAKELDDLIEGSALPAATVSSTLLFLEMKGLARALPGNRYVKG